MHEPDHYTFALKNPESAEIALRTFKAPAVKIFADVSTDQKMWVEVFRYGNGCYKQLNIHVHSERNIEGGGWDHGKFGRGNTVVVE